MTIFPVPSSKSITARALFLASAAQGTTVLSHPLDSDDSAGFTAGLLALGYQVDRSPESWRIQGRPQGPAVASAEVFCRDGATTSRFLPVLAAAGHGLFHFDASAQMRRRPIGPIVRGLRDLGVDVAYEGEEGHHPIRVRAEGVQGGRITLDAGISSQFLTALLMLGPLTSNGLAIEITDLVSEPYVDITVAMMERFGAHVRRDGNTFHVASGGYTGTEYSIEPDASTASYFLAAAAITGKSITIPGLGSESLQGDLKFAEVLASMGADIDITTNAVTVGGAPGRKLSGITVDMRDISDTMPTLAAIAPYADGPVRIENVYNTRFKECDRLDACAENLTALGITVKTGRDWIEIQPGLPRPAQITTRHDHRIAMAFSVTGLRAAGITIDDPGCVKKTFPDFHQAIAELEEAWTNVSDAAR